ncbi:class I SAM-dependent methyltransferase [Micromonospora sp. NPDC049679]|uniref:class I SAM-dependent methyltransferase n=1 Tax=Micromonospora sp. NPDC049679 TaxID=3155920 RepID=UPI0033EEA966
MEGSPSLPFDRVADRYDETRGGEPRGRLFAAGIAPWLLPGRVLEIGVGTGLIAAPLREQGYAVCGVDLSPAMLARARARLGPRIALGDALALPVATASVDSVAFVAALHAIGDVTGALHEAARVLRPGGRLVALHAPGSVATDSGAADGGAPDPAPPVDVSPLLDRVRNDRPDTPHRVAAAARAAGLTTVTTRTLTVGTRRQTPNELADAIAERIWSNLWRLDDATWQAVVVPVIDGLRALPEPDRPRLRPHTFRLAVFER